MEGGNVKAIYKKPRFCKISYMTAYAVGDEENS